MSSADGEPNETVIENKECEELVPLDLQKPSDFVPMRLLTEAKDVYERLISLKGQVTRQKRRIEILQDEFDATPIDQNRRIGRHVDAAKGRLHLLNVSLEEAEEKLIEVSLPHALVLVRELELQQERLEASLLYWQEKFNITGNGKFKLRRDETQERIELLCEALEIARLHQSINNVEYYDYWEERVEWLLESKFKHALKNLNSNNLILDRSFDEVERMEKHLHADKQQGVFHKVLLVVKYIQLHAQVQYIDLSVNKKIGNWINLITGSVLNETPPNVVAARAIVRAQQKSNTDDPKIPAEHNSTPEETAQLSLEDRSITSPTSPTPVSPKLTKAMKKMQLPPMAHVHSFRMSRCFIEDESIEALSKSLKENYSLTVLKVSNNAFTNIGVGHLAKAMRKNGTLTHLDLSGNDLTKSGTDHRNFEAFTSACNHSVRSLKLRNCSIYFRGALAFPMLKQNTLQELDLSCNYLTDEGAVILSETFLPRQKNLKHLSLSECYIRNKGFIALMSIFTDKNSRPVCLQRFELTHNTITDPGLIELATNVIPKILENHGEDCKDIIKFLELQNNFFTSAVGKTLADALVRCPYFATNIKLEASDGSTCGPNGGSISPGSIIEAEDILQLNDLALGNICASVVAQMLIHNDKINHLNLARNRISTEGAVMIVEAVLDHGTINSLDLSCNNVDLNDPVMNGKFFSTILKCKNLRSLKLDKNGIGHDGFWSIVSFIGGNPPLEALSLQGNNFGIKRSFEILLNNLKLNKSLMWLDLRYNPYLLNELVMTGDGYAMIANQINRVCSELIVPPFHDVDMEIPELATPDEQKYQHKFRERMLKKIREMLKRPGEMDQTSNLWMGRYRPGILEEKAKQNYEERKKKLKKKKMEEEEKKRNADNNNKK